MPDDTSRPGTTKVSRASPKFGVRMPPETRALLNRKANAAGLSESALIRALIEDAPIVSAAEQTARQQTNAQLARIGNNLNQLAVRVNSGEWGAVVRVQVIAVLMAMERALQAISVPSTEVT
mgnify:CR=1 FL=1